MDNEAKIKELEDELKTVTDKLDTTTTQLNKYLLRNIKYYETHKEEKKQWSKEYYERNNRTNKFVPTPEQRKVYARRAYLKKKEKLRIIAESNKPNPPDV